MLILDRGRRRVMTPLPIHYILVLIVARVKGETYPEENLSILAGLSG